MYLPVWLPLCVWLSVGACGCMSVSLIMLCLPVCLYVYLFSCGCLTSVNMPSSLLVSPVSRCRVHSQAHGKREYSAKNTHLCYTRKVREHIQHMCAPTSQRAFESLATRVVPFTVCIHYHTKSACSFRTT